MYNLKLLDFSKAKKNWCAANVALAFWTKALWNAYDWVKYIDKKLPDVWDVVVVDRYNIKLYPKKDAWYNYWHVAVITAIEWDYITTSDWYYTKYRFNKNNAAWFISPEKMIKLGAKNIKLSDITYVTQEDLNNIAKKWYYEEIFNKEFGWKSSIYKNMSLAKKSFWDIAYFLAIWLERINKNNKQ